MDSNQRKPNFCETEHCLLRQHCGTCRLFNGGRQWRESMLQEYRLPKDQTDFECPFGLQWQPEAQGQQNAAGGNPPAAPARKKGCGACSRKRAQAQRHSSPS